MSNAERKHNELILHQLILNEADDFDYDQVVRWLKFADDALRENSTGRALGADQFVGEAEAA
jgi:hypothetical protein